MEKLLLFCRERRRHLEGFSREFLVETAQQHQDILTRMGLENFCVEPYFSSLRHNMRELLEVLAAVAAGVPRQNYGFYGLETPTLLPTFLSEGDTLHIIPCLSALQSSSSSVTTWKLQNDKIVRMQQFIGSRERFWIGAKYSV